MAEGPRGAHLLSGEFKINASSATAWEVLTDYDHMASFVSSVKESRKISVENDLKQVEQVMIGQAGFFRKRIHLLLNLTEEPFRLISFKDTSKRSFKSYEGSWEIQNHDPEIKILYRLEAIPAFFSPSFADGAFKRSVKRLLEEVRAEIIKRESR